eukprot:TRINITY_DN6921_c0_g1_i1.p1 TRINITY_DN6921_c0_g1~~TRINITY_DN6921_c0_g1_i1.p1  ORF type:complete len:420 (+),score=76.63 TRINITY_DN6921_c0_g1_i1:202-1461(+)
MGFVEHFPYLVLGALLLGYAYLSRHTSPVSGALVTSTTTTNHPRSGGPGSGGLEAQVAELQAELLARDRRIAEMDELLRNVAQLRRALREAESASSRGHAQTTGGEGSWVPQPQSLAAQFPSQDVLRRQLSPKCLSYLKVLGAERLGGNFNGQWNQDWFAWVNFFSSGFYNFSSGPSGGRKGFYVDVGSNQPKYLSNTWFYDECLGWKGVCIEANPKLAAMLRSQRSCVVVDKCIHPTKSSVSFNTANEVGHVDDETVLPQVKARAAGVPSSRVTVPCTTLREVFAQLNVRHVDWMSIDIEGSEMGALATIPWDRTSIDVITMENVYSANEQRWYVMGRGYGVAAQLGQDEVFVRHGSRASARLASGPLYYPAKDDSHRQWRIITRFLKENKCCLNGPPGSFNEMLADWPSLPSTLPKH